MTINIIIRFNVIYTETELFFLMIIYLLFVFYVLGLFCLFVCKNLLLLFSRSFVYFSLKKK